MKNQFYTAFLLGVSAIVLNMGAISEAFSCTVQSNGNLNCGSSGSYSGTWTCDEATSTCRSGSIKVTYDASTGNKTSERRCSNSACTSYSQGYEYTYDSTTGKMISDVNCRSYSGGTCTSYGDGKYYSYDATTGNKTSDGYCSSHNSNGKCTSYSGSTYDATSGKTTSNVNYDTDSQGNTKTSTTNYNSNGSSTGSTTTYTDKNGAALTGTYKNGDYTYNVTNGTMTDYRYDYSSTCYKKDSDGKCQKGGYSITYDANGKETSYVQTDPDGNQKVTVNGQTTYLDSKGNALTGKFKDGKYTYNYDDGTRTGYEYGYSNGSGTGKYSYYYEYDAAGHTLSESYTSGCNYTDLNGKCQTGGYEYDYEYDAAGHKISESYTKDCYRRDGFNACQEGGAIYEYDENGKQTKYTQFDQNGNQKVTENGQTIYLDAEGNPLTGTFSDGSYTYSAEDGIITGYTRESCVSTVNNNPYYKNCQFDIYDCSVNPCSRAESSWGRSLYDSSSGMQYFCKDQNNCYILSDGAIEGKMSCDNGGENCDTEFYDVFGNIKSEYGANGNPLKAYDYYDDGTALVYDDQCRVKERLDPNGNSMYDFGDTLLSENRRTRYTPAEAAEIVGDSQDNMIVMYFK